MVREVFVLRSDRAPRAAASINVGSLASAQPVQDANAERWGIRPSNVLEEVEPQRAQEALRLDVQLEQLAGQD